MQEGADKVRESAGSEDEADRPMGTETEEDSEVSLKTPRQRVVASLYGNWFPIEKTMYYAYEKCYAIKFAIY